MQARRAARSLHSVTVVALVVATTGLWPSARSAAETPLTADGRPDLAGTWDNGSGIDFVQPVQDGDSICIIGCAQGPYSVQARNRPNYRPEYEAHVSDLNTRQVEEDTVLRCFPPGVPRIGPPDKIVQTPSELVFLYDDYSGNYFRVVPVDGRGHRTDVEPTFLGDAIGWWDDDTLVVETVNFNDETWLIDDGSFHTTNLRVIERIRRDGDMLSWDATAYDPEILAEPWVLNTRVAQLTDQEILEAPPCIERDLEHRFDDTNHDNNR